jgi:hypothetical protein
LRDFAEPEKGAKMLIRSLVTFLLVLLFSVPSHAQFLRRAIEHRIEGNVVGVFACNVDAARFCPGTSAEDGSRLQCLKGHRNQLSFSCAKELRKLK